MNTLAKNILLTPHALDETSIAKLLDVFRKPNIDDADFYFQNSTSQAWYLEDSQVKSGSFSDDQGVGIRAVSGDKTGFAFSEQSDLSSLKKAVSAAAAIATTGIGSGRKLKITNNFERRYDVVNPIENDVDKIAILEAVDKAIRAKDSRVIQVTAALSVEHEVIMIAGLHIPITTDIRPMLSLQVTVMVEDKDSRREIGRAGGGGRFGFENFSTADAISLAIDALNEALINLEALDAPAGSMPVILGPGWPGVLLHEAVGHGLEGDFNRKQLSSYSGKLGQQVASRGVSIVDNGTLAKRRGSLSVDDEGTPSQCTTLIENGVLVNYMQDKLNARLMNMQATGNCRRESYSHIPLPRMTNTYMLAGKYEPEEIIKTVKKGIYAVNFGGGQVDITSGQFVFSASEAYLIENGKVTAPVKGATLIGEGFDVMNKVSMVGNDLKLDKGQGVCGKDGQSVPVGVGQPTLKIDDITVGGTKA